MRFLSMLIGPTSDWPLALLFFIGSSSHMLIIRRRAHCWEYHCYIPLTVFTRIVRGDLS